VVELLLLLGLLVGPLIALALLVGLLEETGLLQEVEEERLRWLAEMFDEERGGFEAPRK
jgi:hypothetical protein